MVTSYHCHHDDHDRFSVMVMGMMYMAKEAMQMMTIKCYYGDAPTNYIGDFPLLWIAHESNTGNKPGYLCFPELRLFQFDCL